MSLFNFVNQYDEAWKAIIQPGRQEYNTYDLGPTDFIVKNQKIKRTDFRLLNKRGHIIECSFFQHSDIEDPMPCVIYLHANGCCRLEALQYSDLVLASGISLFCFDFSGCGKSDGLYSTVGWFEQDDLECIIQYVFNTGRVSKVAIWGRSMGAITTILYAGKDPRISCIILDSPFANFKQLIKEVAKKKALIPEFLSVGAFNMIRKTILKKAEFDIDGLRPIKYVDKIKIPALFGHAKDDTFVLPQHSKDLYTTYGGPKELMMFEGDHNSERPVNWLLLVKKFLTSYLIEAKTPPKESLKVPQGLSEINNSTKSTDATKDKENQKAKPIQKSSKKVLPSQLNDPQKDMKFTWLEHSASSPQLLTAADIFKNEKLHNQTIADIVNETSSNQAAHMKLKLLEHKSSASTSNQNKAVNMTMIGYPSSQSTYTIEPTQKPINKTRLNENRRHSTFNIYPQEAAKTHRQLLRGNSDYTSVQSTSLLSHYQEPPSTIPTTQTQYTNKFTSVTADTTKQNKSKYENNNPNITNPAPQTTQVKKAEIFMKDKGGSCPTSTSNPNYSIPEISNTPTYTIDLDGSHTARLTKGMSMPASTADISAYLNQSKTQSGGIPSFGHPSQMPSFSEHVRGPLQEKNMNEVDTSSLSRNMSMKSFTSGAENAADTSRRDLSPSMHKRRPVLFQMNLNSKVPFINPNQTSALINMDFLVHSENNINFRSDRRMSDNPANILKALVNGAGQDRAALGYRGGGESKGSYLGNKMASK